MSIPLSSRKLLVIIVFIAGGTAIFFGDNNFFKGSFSRIVPRQPVIPNSQPQAGNAIPPFSIAPLGGMRVGVSDIGVSREFSSLPPSAPRFLVGSRSPGQACDLSSECRDGLRCTSHLCEPRWTLGEACKDQYYFNVCRVGFCQNSICSPQIRSVGSAKLINDPNRPEGTYIGIDPGHVTHALGYVRNFTQSRAPDGICNPILGLSRKNNDYCQFVVSPGNSKAVGPYIYARPDARSEYDREVWGEPRIKKIRVTMGLSDMRTGAAGYNIFYSTSGNDIDRNQTAWRWGKYCAVDARELDRNLTNFAQCEVDISPGLTGGFKLSSIMIARAEGGANTAALLLDAIQLISQ